MLLTLKKNNFHYYFKQHPLYHSYCLFLKYFNELSPNTNPHPHTLPSSLLYYSSNEMEKKGIVLFLLAVRVFSFV